MTCAPPPFLIVFYRNWLAFKEYALYSIVPDILDNVIWFAAFALGVGSMVTTGRDEYISFLVPGAVILTGLYYSSSEATYSLLPKLSKEGVWVAALGASVSLRQLMFGEVLWASVRGLFSALALYLICVLLGLVDQPAYALVGFVVVFISYFSFCSFGVMVTSFVKQSHLLSYYFVLWLSPSLLFSGIYFEVDKLPKTAEIVANFVPMTHSVSLMQKIYLDQQILVADVLTFSCIMVVLTSASLFIAHKNFKKRLFD